MHLEILISLMKFFYILHAQRNNTGQNKIRKNVKIAWMEKPPYIMRINQSWSGKPEGLLRKTVWHFIELGCDRYAIHTEAVEVDSMDALVSLVQEGKAQVGLPIFMENFGEFEKYEGFLLLKVLDHPGLEFITTGQKPNGLLITVKAVLHSWPLLLVTTLLTAIAGVIVWALVR